MGQLANVVLVALTAALSGADVIELNPDVTETLIESPNYPDPIPANTVKSWKITSPPGTKMELNCYEIRLIQDTPPHCNQDSMVIMGGTERLELCGEHYGLRMTSIENVLSVELVTGGEDSGGISCKVRVSFPEKTTPTKPTPVENRIELLAGGEPHNFRSNNYPGMPGDYLRQSWHFNTSPNSTIRITCADFRLTQRSKTECADETVTITDGPTTRVLCGIKSGFTVLSESNRMSFQFETGEHGRGAFRCLAQGKLMDWYGEMTTVVPPYLGIKSEEIDSTEHGGHPGPKSTNCPCGWANKGRSRIVNGVETAVNEFPFMVALIDNVRKYQFCGGSIISPYHALTAAHCTIQFLISGDPMSIFIGDHNLYVEDETNAARNIDVERIIQHESFNSTTFKHDISLLLLAERIEFNKFVGPVCLSRVQLEIPGQYVTSIGWGRVAWNGTRSDYLRKVKERVIQRNTCSRAYSYVDELNPTQICTYSSNKSSCQGDSGGPVVWLDPETNRYVQVGLVSFGRICADENPSVQTDVSAYYGWIQQNIAASAPQQICSKAG